MAYLLWHGMPSAAWRALNNADRYELLSLQPYYPSHPDYHGQKILGSVVIADAEIRDRLNRAFQRGVRESHGERAACFNPHHGIRVTSNGVTTDFVICFECRQVQVWRGDEKIDYFLVSESPRPVFDEVLKNAAVPLVLSEPSFNRPPHRLHVNHNAACEDDRRLSDCHPPQAASWFLL